MTGRPIPILVLGAPRSGTTLLGNYIGSASRMCNLGEFNGYYLALYSARELQRRAARPYIDEYVDALFDHAREFAAAYAMRAQARAYCDSSPLNLLICDELAARLCSAVFVLVIRHHIGVIQSLERSYQKGILWAGATLEERATLYNRFYCRAAHLPAERTIAISYDGLCAAPEESLTELEREIVERIGPVGRFDRTVLASSHANQPNSARPTLGCLRSDGSVDIAPIPSADHVSWDEEQDTRTARHVVASVQVLAPWLRQMRVLTDP